MEQDRRAAGVRGQGQFCRVCGRPLGEPPRLDCVSCANLFALLRGQCLYDAQTGKIWFRSTGNRTLVRPGYGDEAMAMRAASAASGRPLRTLWWILVLGAMIINGYLGLLR